MKAPIYDYRKLAHWDVLEKQRGLTSRVKQAQQELLEKYGVNTREEALVKIVECWENGLARNDSASTYWVHLQLQYLKYLYLYRKGVKRLDNLKSNIDCAFGSRAADRLQNTSQKLKNEEKQFAEIIWSLRPQKGKRNQLPEIKQAEELLTKKISMYLGLHDEWLYRGRRFSEHDLKRWADKWVLYTSTPRRSSDESMVRWLNDWVKSSGTLRQPCEEVTVKREPTRSQPCHLAVK